MRSRHLAMLVVAVLMTLPAAPGTLAYEGQVAANATITGPTGEILLDQPYDFKATVIDLVGMPVTDEEVIWTIEEAPPGAADTIDPPNTITDSNGVADTSITFGGVPGPRVIRVGVLLSGGTIQVNATTKASGFTPRTIVGTCTSVLGLKTTGHFTTTTKVQRLGGYITFRLTFKPYRNLQIVVARAVRTGLRFGPFVNVTTRITDKEAHVYYAVRFNKARWLSVRGSGPNAKSLACQGRWRAPVTNPRAPTI